MIFENVSHSNYFIHELLSLLLFLESMKNRSNTLKLRTNALSNQDSNSIIRLYVCALKVYYKLELSK